MKLILILLSGVLGFSIAAQAESIIITPQVPIDCKQKEVMDVSRVTILPSPTGDDTSFALQVEYGTCQLGKIDVKPILDDYNFYLVNEEYSRDFQYDHSAVGSSLSVVMKLNPPEFFAQYGARHFVLSFYPSSGSLSFNFNVVFTKDAVTGQVRMMLSPR